MANPIFKLQYVSPKSDLRGWFVFQEIKMMQSEAMRSEGVDPSAPEHSGELLCRCVERMPLEIPEGLGLVKELDEIVAGPGGEVGHGGVVELRRAAHPFVFIVRTLRLRLGEQFLQIFF